MKCPHCNKEISTSLFHSELGKSSARRLSAKERKERASNAAKARWAKKRLEK